MNQLSQELSTTKDKLIKQMEVSKEEQQEIKKEESKLKDEEQKFQKLTQTEQKEKSEISKK